MRKRGFLGFRDIVFSFFFTYVGMGFVIYSGATEKNGPWATRLEPTIFEVLCATGQTPYQCCQSRPSEVSYSGLPLMGIPDPTLIRHL